MLLLTSPESRENTDEPADATGSGGFDRAFGRFAIDAFPEINPVRAEHRRQITNLENLHAAGVHENKPAVKVQDLDAITAAFDQTLLEFEVCSKVLTAIGLHFRRFGFHAHLRILAVFITFPAQPAQFESGRRFGEEDQQPNGKPFRANHKKLVRGNLVWA